MAFLSLKADVLHSYLFKGGLMNIILWVIRQRLLQLSKKCRNHYSSMYHAKSQWVKRSDTHLSSWINVKKFVRLKFKIKSIACKCPVFAVCLPSVCRIGMLEIILGEALLFQINIFLLQHFVDDIKEGNTMYCW